MLHYIALLFSGLTGLFEVFFSDEDAILPLCYQCRLRKVLFCTLVIKLYAFFSNLSWILYELSGLSKTQGSKAL